MSALGVPAAGALYVQEGVGSVLMGGTSQHNMERAGMGIAYTRAF